MTALVVPRTETDWYVANLRATKSPVPELTEKHHRCFAVLQAITAPSGIYNLSTPGSVCDMIEVSPFHVSVLLMNEFSTFGFDHMTRLVIASHRYGVRSSLSPWRPHMGDDRRLALVAEWRFREYDMEGPVERIELDEKMAYGILELTLHARGDDRSHGWGYHPTLEDLSARALKAAQ